LTAYLFSANWWKDIETKQDRITRQPLSDAYDVRWREDWTVAASNKLEKTFAFRFIDVGPKVLLELTNRTTQALRSIDILTVFLKDKESLNGSSQVHIRFDTVKAMRPGEKAVLFHRTWINGSPVNGEQDQLERLKIVAGEPNPYVLDISWEDLEGKTQFQRIPIGH
jgi:hypothetical protein